MKFAFAADLHFGSVPEDLAVALADDMNALRPDLVAIGGDLTLGARTAEFAMVQRWMGQIEAPLIVIAGNHDVSSRNLIERFGSPLRRFRAATRTWPVPNFTFGDKIVVGLNTVASWQPHLRWEEGVVRRRDIDEMELLLKTQSTAAFKAVIAHHPFVAVPGIRRAEPLRRADRALNVFAQQGVDMVLTGHLHLSFVHEWRYRGGSILMVGAPTALSTRMRGEVNGYWLVEVDDTTITMRLRRRIGGHFADDVVQHYPRRRRADDRRPVDVDAQRSG